MRSSNDIADLHAKVDTLTELVRQLVHASSPAASMTAREKAEALSKALATGDKRILRATQARINGGRS